MDIKLTQRNNETIGVFTFFDHSNRDPKITAYHQKVTTYFQIPVNYISIDYRYINHGGAIERTIKGLYNQVDYLIFWDNDNIPLKKDIIDIIYDKIKDKRSIFSNAVNSNHIHQNHQYAAANAFSISSELYKKLGEPHLADMVKRSDTCEQATFACQELGYNVCLVYPTSFYELTDDEMKETGNPKFWNLGNGKDYQLKYGLCTQYGDLFYHAGMANIKRGGQLFIQKCEEILSHKKETLQCIIASVGMDDLLEITLPLNKEYFDDFIVITTKEDIKTQEVCLKNNVRFITTDLFYKDGTKFNRGACYNLALKYLKYNNSWVLFLDSDIVLSKDYRSKLELERLDKNKCYGVARRFCWTYNEWIEYKENRKNINDLLRVPGYMCGFYQLWHQDSECLKDKVEVYPGNYPSTEQSDIAFLYNWCQPPDPKPEKQDHLDVIHLGPPSIFNNGKDNCKLPELNGMKFKDLPDLRHHEFFKECKFYD